MHQLALFEWRNLCQRQKKIYLRLSSYAQRADMRRWVWFFDLAILLLDAIM